MSRDRLVDAILAFLTEQDVVDAGEVRAELEREVEAAGDAAVLALRARLAADNGWEYYPRDPLAQRIYHRLADRFVGDGSVLLGAEHLSGLAGTPVVVVSNHVSYADANVIEILLQRSGATELGNRLTALAGPKVFTSRERRFSSLCFGSIKVPQSVEVSSGQAVLNPREVARGARRAIAVAHERLLAGDALLLFAEGTRSRSGSMQPLLPAVARYLETPGTLVLPVGLTGPEHLFPVDDATLRPARIVLQVGDPVPADALRTRAGRDRRVTMDAIGLAVAELLPEAYRGEYGRRERFDQAARVLDESRRVA